RYCLCDHSGLLDGECSQYYVCCSAFLRELLNVRDASDSTPHFYRDFNRLHDFMDYLPVLGGGDLECSIEIDDMDQVCSGLLVLSSNRYRIFVVRGRAVVASFHQADQPAASEIDCGNYAHA